MANDDLDLELNLDLDLDSDGEDTAAINFQSAPPAPAPIQPAPGVRTVTDTVSKRDEAEIDMEIKGISRKVDVDDLARTAKAKKVRVVDKKALRDLISNIFERLIHEKGLDLSPQERQELMARGEQVVKADMGTLKTLQRQLDEMQQANANLVQERDAWAASVEEHRVALEEARARVGQWQEDRDKTQEQLRNLQEETSTLRRKKDDEGEVAKLKAMLDESRQRVADLVTRAGDIEEHFEGQLNEANGELEVAKNRVAELEEQLAAQAAGAEELEKAQVRIADLENEIGIYAEQGEELDVANAKVAELEADLQAQAGKGEELEAAQAQVTQLQQDLETQTTNAQALDAANADANAKVSELQTEVEDLTVKAAEVDAANAKVTDLETEIEGLAAKTAELDAATAQVSALQQEVEDLGSKAGELDQAKAQITELESQLGDQQATSAELDATRSKVTGLQEELAIQSGKAAELDVAQARCSELEQELADLNTRFDEVAEKVVDAEMELEMSRSMAPEEEDATAGRITELELEISDLRQQLQEAPAKTQTDEIVHDQVSALSVQLDKRNQELDSLRNELDTIRLEAKKAASSAAAADSARWQAEHDREQLTSQVHNLTSALERNDQNQLAEMLEAGAAVSNTDPKRGYVSWQWDSKGSEHVALVDSQGHIWYAERQDTTWEIADLTASSGAPAVKSGMLTGYAPLDIQHILFVDAEGKLWELWYDGTWHPECLSDKTGTPAAEGPPRGVYLPDRHLVVYPQEGGELVCLSYTDDWHNDVG